MIIGVIGGEDTDRKTLRIAEEVGRRIAERGAYVVCGGLGGVMEAACRGAKAGGGVTIGVLPTASKADANPYVDIPIVTGMGVARNVVIVRTADALVAVDGHYGTLSEIAHALDIGKRVVLLESWDLEKVGADPRLLLRAKTPAEAVDLAVRAAEES